VQQAAVAVGLDGDGFFTKAGQLSGGMRRRLSIAMSLVGDPPIIFMDGKSRVVRVGGSVVGLRRILTFLFTLQSPPLGWTRTTASTSGTSSRRSSPPRA
jgi:ABC-type phosphonate transport system ATPase subunit